MTHKITYDQLAAQVARTMAALPEADWNDGSKPKLPLENPAIAAKQEAPAVRRAFATWGPDAHTANPPLIYAPRWKTDHHPWRVDGGTIRYAGHEVREVREVQA